MDPLYAYQAVNVETQQADPHSLLMWMRRTIAIRRQYKVFGRGTNRLLYPKNRKVLAYLRHRPHTFVMKIQQVARQTSLSIHALRYYEQVGLVAPVERASNGHREYTEDDIYRVVFVTRLRARA